MSEYPDLDAEERMTPEQRVKASVERLDKLVHFTPEEKTRWEANRHRDILMDIQLETERIEAAEKAIKTAAYQKARARRKAKREALEAGMSPGALDYHKKLEEALRILRKSSPPREMFERDFLRIKAMWDLIFDRFKEFESANPAPRAKKDDAIVAEYTVVKEEKP